MSLTYIILIFAYLILITPKTKIKRNLADDYDNFIYSGKTKKFCGIPKDPDFNIYEIIGILPDNYNKINIEIAILKEMYDEDEDISFSYCGMEDYSLKSSWNCIFGASIIFPKKTENEEYYFFNTSFSLNKDKDYKYLDFMIEVPDDCFLECVTVYFKVESDDGSNSTIYIIIFVLLFIVIALILIFYIRRLRRIKAKEIETIDDPKFKD